MRSPDNVRSALPAPHREVIDGLVAFVADDPRFRFVELCCSAARGAADELSDLDLGLGVDDGAWPDATEAILPALHRIGEVVDALTHRMREWGERPHLRVFVQYAAGPQVDLVALPASSRAGLPPGSVALYDPDGRLAQPMEVPIRRATATDVAEWTFLAWVALLDLDKYLRRGSEWEALDRLHEARGLTWRLIAVARGVEYPAYGLTSLLDAPGDPSLPPEMGETVSALDLPRLRAAGLSLADRLDEATAAASEKVGEPPAHRRFAAEPRRRDGARGRVTPRAAVRALPRGARRVLTPHYPSRKSRVTAAKSGEANAL